jgi:outer membrane protein W
MRVKFIALATLLLATSVFAQDRLLVFAISKGAGIGMAHDWNSHWTTELSIAAESRQILSTRLITVNNPSGNTPLNVPVTENASVQSVPIDLTTRFRFANTSRVTPYLGAGVRYVRAPQNIQRLIVIGNGPLVPVTLLPYSDRTSGEVAGGLTVRLTPHIGVEADVKRLLRSDNVPFDSLTRTSVGLNFSF